MDMNCLSVKVFAKKWLLCHLGTKDFQTQASVCVTPVHAYYGLDNRVGEAP